MKRQYTKAYDLQGNFIGNVKGRWVVPPADDSLPYDPAKSILYRVVTPNNRTMMRYADQLIVQHTGELNYD